MPVPVITVEQMRRWEAASWAAGRSEAEVISQVGKLVARRVLELTQPGDVILILAGKGNNGADARAAEAHLIDRHLMVLKIVEPGRAFSKLQELLERKPALIIDGLFGIGLNRELSSDWSSSIDAINATGIPVFSVDNPSGLDAESGIARGAAVRARWTFTLGAPKAGLLKPGTAEYVGRLEVAPEIGLTPCREEAELVWNLADDFKGYPPVRPVDGHKGTFGHVVILGGSTGYHGAAVLAARAAQRAMPGLVTLCVPPEVYVPVASQLQSVMVHPWREDWELPASASAIVLGPGLAGKEFARGLKDFCVQHWRSSRLPVLADASALDWLPEGPVKPEAVRVITPHPGEAGRMLGQTAKDVQKDRVGAVRGLSSRWGRTWVILKGSHTLIGRHAGIIGVNSSGNPGLAQGGSGDILAGYLGGLLAQPRLQADVGKILGYGVWRHGATADELNVKGAVWTIEELIPRLG